MDINDYNNRLSQARSNYREAADELKDNFNSEIDDRDEVHSNVQKKQRDNFVEAKNKIETNVAETISTQNKDVKESMLKSTERFRNETASQQESFDIDRQELQRKFDTKLNNLRDSYSKDLASRERTQNDLLGSSEARYEDSTKRNTEYFQGSINKLDHDTSNALREQKDNHKAEKRAQESGHHNTMQDLVRSGNSSRNKMVENSQRDLQSLRDTQSDELRNLKDHHTSSRQALYKQKGIENEEIAGNFRELTDDITSRNNSNNARSAKMNSEHIQELQRDFAQTNYQTKRELQEKLKGGSALEKDKLKSSEQQGRFDTKMKNVNSNIEDIQYKNQVDKERMSSSFQDSVRERNLSFAKQIDAKETDMRDFKQNALKDNQESTDKIVSDYQFKLSKNQVESEQQGIKSQESAKQRLSTQRQEFGRVVNQMSDINNEAVSKMQEDHADEKTKFIQLTRRNQHDAIEDLKDNHDKVITKKETSLSQRIDTKDKELNQTVTRYEDKIEMLQNNSRKELETTKQIENERRVEDTREFKRQIRKMTDANTKEKVGIRDEFDRKLQNAKHQSDVKFSKTVQKYEGQLDRERTDTRRHFKTKIKQLESNYHRLADQNAIEKDLMTNQFERRIEEMKQANEIKLEDLRSQKTSQA